MDILFISNYLNHHQIPLCQSLCNISGINFIFLATQKVPEFRKQLGYKSDFQSYAFYREAILEQDFSEAEKLCFDADVLILGEAEHRFVKRRLKAKKLTFKYSERWFKSGFWRHPGDVLRAIRAYTINNQKNYYLLCASAYTAKDSSRILAFPNKKYKWGYFPELIRYSNFEEMVNKKKKNSLLWVARFIECKHPEVALDIAQRLKKDGYDFTMQLIGEGELEDEIKKKIIVNGLEDRVRLLGSMPPDQVRNYMEESAIFLFTSDFREGWGAVLNEAMNSGCVVIASHAIGSAPYLIEHNVNGFIYSNGKTEQLYRYVKMVIDNGEVQHTIAREAYKTISETWNSDVAAARLYDVSTSVINGLQIPKYEEGPLSKDYGG